ncbi:alpha/beta fold hydrolase [soil metagenome]
MQTHNPVAAACAAIARVERGATVHRLEHAGTTVVWRRFGNGPPMVLLHGGHGSWLHWLRNVEPLAANHTVLVPDMPGFGESDDIDGDPHAADRLDRALAALGGTLDQLIAPQGLISLIGFSYGGVVAAAFAARRGMVERMALIGPGGHGTARRQPVPMVDWRLDDTTAMRAALRHNLRVQMLHDPDAVDSLSLEIHERSCVATRFRSRAISRASVLKDHLAAITAPILFLWGEHDVTADPKVAAPHVTESRPDRPWRIIPGAGHWAQYENPHSVNRMLVEWFGPPK